jgi:hypothetical protein
MSKSTNQQFREADAAIERAVAAFMSAIDHMMKRWDGVAAQYILERVLLELCEELPMRIGTRSIGPATVKLSNALADYRESPAEERG